MPRRNNGPRLKFLEKRNGYYICWTEGGRSRERSAFTTDRGEAEKALADFIVRRTKTTRTRHPNETLVSEVLTDYALQNEGRPAATRIGYALVALGSFWANKTVADVHENSCRKYVTQRKISNSTAKRELTVLRAAINFAIQSSKLSSGAPVWLPKESIPRDIWLERNEFAQLLRAARSLPRGGEHLPLFLLVAIYTARRKEAILSLRWTRVDFRNGTIDFRRPGVAETNKKRGVVKMHRKLIAHLRREKARQAIGRDGKQRSVGEMEFVIQWNGEGVQGLRRSFPAAVKAAKLEKHITPHTLKHSSITWMVQAGTPLWDVAQFAATSVATIEKVYAHHSPMHHERALKAFG
jgi:integrase